MSAELRPVVARITPSLSTAALTLGLLTGCMAQGPAGVVVAKDYRTPPASKTRPYFLTVRTANGDRTAFQINVKDLRPLRHRRALPRLH
ncbi:hypothetical protein [Streptomyces sp. NPDC059349]|uniref:hypothetical protein n=1 Tax=Streptomyces sp. NPDC059349 TaxID=3346808 RepID=UPI003696CFFF